MKLRAKALILSLSTLVALPAFAAAHDQHLPQKTEWQKHDDHRQVAHNPHVQPRKVQPIHDWKAGQKVPSHYWEKSYKIDHAQYKKLYKPSRNQQWIKVNGDYILINTINHSIIKIVRG